MSRTAGLKKLSAISASGTRVDTNGRTGKAGTTSSGRRRLVGALDVVGHQDRVDEVAASSIVGPAVALPAETELLVQGDRRVVVREHMQLELADADLAGPADRLLQQRAPDAAASGGGR